MPQCSRRVTSSRRCARLKIWKSRTHRVRSSSGSSRDAMAEFRRVNVDGTVHLARQAIAAGVRRFVYISSIKVNGEATSPGRPFRADDVPAPLDAYGRSKLEAERALLELSRGNS